MPCLVCLFKFIKNVDPLGEGSSKNSRPILLICEFDFKRNLILPLSADRRTDTPWIDFKYPDFVQRVLVVKNFISMRLILAFYITRPKTNTTLDSEAFPLDSFHCCPRLISESSWPFNRFVGRRIPILSMFVLDQNMKVRSFGV